MRNRTKLLVGLTLTVCLSIAPMVAMAQTEGRGGYQGYQNDNDGVDLGWIGLLGLAGLLGLKRNMMRVRGSSAATTGP
jgi:hypothetical protein